MKIENLLVFLNIFLIITHKARSKVRFIVIDMYSPYISLILKMFPNASIIIDKFHLTQLISKAFNNNYHNGYIEGNNNFIKVIKRIAFGSRSFSRFKARIMICKGLILPKRKEA